ncbi:MAG: hypothetical protein WC319_02720 [Candidatus Paceibacterota bacterium]|jgi:hypothetical protein
MESSGDANYDCCDEKPRDNSKGIIHWVIKTHYHNIDRIEIWGDIVQKVDHFDELLGKRVFVRIFMKSTSSKRFIDLFRKKVEPIQTAETNVINFIGHDGSIPIIEIGNRKVYAHIIMKIIEWPGYDYPPFKKAPR